MKKILGFIKRSLLTENPSLVLLLGLCTLLGTSASLISGFAMGICTLLVLVMSGVTISLVGMFFPAKVRDVLYMVVVAFFVALIEILLRAFLPEVHSSLGIYLPLISVSGIAFARAENSGEEKPGTAALNGLSMGVGFFAVSFVMSFVRELIGQGTFFGLRMIPEEYAVRLVASPFGAFVILGCMFAVFKKIADCFLEKEGEK